MAGCQKSEASSIINISGSSTILPVVSAAAEEYQNRHKDIKVGVQGGGSSAGIEAAITGASDIGTSSRDLKGTETKEGLHDTVIAVDAIAIIVNPENPVTKLSKRQASEIFTGKITNWNQVGGHDEDIVLVNRDEASGTREAFYKIVLDKVPFSKNAVIQPGTGQVRSLVGNTRAAIGYISLGYVTDDVKVITYEGVAPSKAAVLSGNYKLQRKLHLFTKGEPTGDTKAFIQFILGEWVQSNIVGREFVPVKDMKQAGDVS